MYKKKLINLTAIVMAMSIAFAPSVTAFAEDSQAPSETWVKNTGEVKEHNGDVQNDSSQWTTVYAEGEGSVVIENGNATNENDKWRAACAHSDGIVEVNGNVEGNYGAGSFKEGTAILNGDVTGRNDDGVKVEGDSYMGVSGDVTGVDDGIETDGTSTIIVEGNVTGGNNGVKVTVNELTGSKDCHCTPKCDANPCTCIGNTGANENIVVVEGTIKSDNTGISVEVKEGLSNCNAPVFYVYEIDAPTAIAANSESLQKHLESHINYIVKNDDSNVTVVSGLKPTTITKIASVDTSRNTTEETTRILTTTLNKAFTVAVANGYELSAGDNVSMVQNADGTYTITLINNKGGITLTARLIQVAAPSAPAAAYAPSEPQHESEEEEVVALFASFSVTNRTDLPEVLGASLEDGVVAKPVVTVKTGKLSAIQYKRTFIDTVKNAPAGSVVRLETSVSYCIDKMMMEALAERPDLTLEVVFPVDHQNVSVTVPAGYDVMSLLDENGYCGFLYLNSVFGANVQ